LSQHDLNIANQGFPAFRADLNDALVALGSTNSGATAPATTFANQLWYDTANNILKIRNEDNDAWISIATLDQTADSVSAIGTKTLPNGDVVGSSDSQTLTNKTLTNPTINGLTGNTAVINIGSGQVYKDTSGNILLNTTTLPTALATNFRNLLIKGDSNGVITAASNDLLSSVGLYSGANSTDVPALLFQNGLRFGLTTDLGTGGFSEKMRTNTYGLGLGGAIPSSGMGITFPATQSASSDVNTLDDYEEGTWTITVTTGTSGSVTASAKTGAYTKVGRLVTISGYIDFSSVSSPVGYLRLSLPFTSGSGVSFESAASFMFNSIVSANVADFIGTVNNNSATLDIYLGNGTIVSATSANQVQASTSIRFQASYMTA
jgi:hypothetical protein